MKWLDRVIRNWRIRRALPHLAKADRVLDVGCGDGELCRRLAKREVAGVGIDPHLAKLPDVAGFEFVPGNFPDALPEGEPVPDFEAILARFEAYKVQLTQQALYVSSLSQKLAAREEQLQQRSESEGGAAG